MGGKKVDKMLTHPLLSSESNETPAQHIVNLLPTILRAYINRVGGKV